MGLFSSSHDQSRGTTISRHHGTIRHARTLTAALTAGILLAVSLTATAPAFAATSYSATSVTASVTGTSVRATARISSSQSVTATQVGICARSASKANVDFPLKSNVLLTSTGTSWAKTATFAAGTFSYWPCVNVGGSWTNIGPVRYFTVAAANTNPAPAPVPTVTNPSGVAMPVGDLTGWKQTFTEDFTAPLARGSFPGSYGSKWLSYTGFTDTSKMGDYDQRIISAQDGNLDLLLHTENGRPLGAAPVPLVNGQWGGQVYGRFSVRMKADPAAGYGTGFLLWPDSDNWNDGEIDFPESGLTDVVKGYNHCLDSPSRNCLVVNTSAKYSDWHTYTIDWTPQRLSFIIDGTVVGSTTTNIPTKPLHWVMQVATTGVTPAASTTGHLLIDWATIYNYVP